MPDANKKVTYLSMCDLFVTTRHKKGYCLQHTIALLKCILLFQIFSKNTKKVRELWWNGIPPSVRGRVWRLAIGNSLNLTPG